MEKMETVDRGDLLFPMFFCILTRIFTANSMKKEQPLAALYFFSSLI